MTRREVGVAQQQALDAELGQVIDDASPVDAVCDPETLLELGQRSGQPGRRPPTMVAIAIHDGAPDPNTFATASCSRCHSRGSGPRMATMAPRQVSASGTRIPVAAAVVAAGTSEQPVDPPGHRLEVGIIDAGLLGRRVGVRPGQDRGDAVARVGVQAIAHGKTSEPRRGPSFGRHGAEQLVDRRPARGGIAGEQLALGRPVALTDRQRRHLGRQHQPLAELDVGLVTKALALDLGCAELPDRPTDRGVEPKEQDQPPTLRRGDGARLVLQREDGPEVESPRVEGPVSLRRPGLRSSRP